MKKWIIAGTAGAAILALIIALSGQMRRAAAAEHALQEAAVAAMNEAAESLEAMSLAMDKLQIAAGAPQQGQLLRAIALHADSARHSMLLLPAAQEDISPALVWLSQFSSDIEAWLAASSGQTLSSDDKADLARAADNVRLLHAELTLAAQDMLLGASAEQALPETALTQPPTAAELVTYKALPSAEIGSGQALQIAKEFVGMERVTGIAPAPDTTGALPVFGVTVQTADVQLNVEVTQRGGKVLLMSPETAAFPQLLTPEECIRAGREFLHAKGFVSMEATYFQLYDGLCVATFVHVQEDTLVWSDRVTVQVRMDTAEVVGLEARSYWQHHTPRKIPAPLLTADEARALLSPDVQLTGVRRCLLPVKGQERLCWQFTAQLDNETYVIYIDAITGSELLLEKVMQLEAGSMPA